MIDRNRAAKRAKRLSLIMHEGADGKLIPIKNTNYEGVLASPLERVFTATQEGSFPKMLRFLGDVAESESMGGRAISNDNSSAAGLFHFLVGNDTDSGTSSFETAKQRVRNLRKKYLAELDGDAEVLATLDKIANVESPLDLTNQEQAILLFADLKMKGNKLDRFLEGSYSAVDLYATRVVTLGSANHSNAGIGINWKNAQDRREGNSDNKLDEALFDLTVSTPISVPDIGPAFSMWDVAKSPLSLAKEQAKEAYRGGGVIARKASWLAALSDASIEDSKPSYFATNFTYSRGGSPVPKAQGGLKTGEVSGVINYDGSGYRGDPEMLFRDKYNTELTPEEQVEFDAWVIMESKRRGRDVLMDMGTYDLHGSWKAGGATDTRGHGSDKWKKPNHPKFSNESIYNGAGGVEGGVWNGPAFTPSVFTNNLYGDGVQRYYKKDEAEYIDRDSRPIPMRAEEKTPVDSDVPKFQVRGLLYKHQEEVGKQDNTKIPIKQK